MQLRKYLAMDYDDSSCCLPFWQKNKQTLDLLFEAALKALSVPSASVGHTCGCGGLVLIPYRCRMTDKILLSLV